MTTTAATLPLPPSLNRTYRAAFHGRTRFYKSAEAKAWTLAAVPVLRAAGLRSVPDDAAISVRLAVRCARNRDLDSVVKITLDAIAEAGGFDDKRILYLHVTKIPTSKRAEHGMDVRVAVQTP